MEQIKAGLRVSCGLDRDPIAAAAFGINLPTASNLQVPYIDFCNLYLRAQPPIRTGFGTLQLEFTNPEPEGGGLFTFVSFFFSTHSNSQSTHTHT